jgi:hypothetical protein
MARGREVLAASNAAAVGWFFSACAAAMSAAFTWLLVTKGAPRQVQPLLMWAALAAFWMVTITIACNALSARRARVEWDGMRAWLVVSTPLSRSEREFGAAELAALAIEGGPGSDDEDWFRCMLTLAGSPPEEVASGSDRQVVEAAEARIRQALRLPAGSAGLS